MYYTTVHQSVKEVYIIQTPKCPSETSFKVGKNAAQVYFHVALSDTWRTKFHNKQSLVKRAGLLQ